MLDGPASATPAAPSGCPAPAITAGRAAATLRADRAAAQEPPAAGDANRDPARPGRSRAGRGVARPTIGAQRLVDHLADRGVRLSASGVQKILRRHQLGRRAQRVAALAQLTAVTTGIVTSDAKQGPFGFCPSPPARAIWSPWTPSMSASSKASGPSGSSPRSTLPPATRSPPWSPGQVGPRHRRLRRPRRRTPGRNRGRAHRGAQR